MTQAQKTRLHNWVKYILTLAGLVLTVVLAHGQMFRSDLAAIRESMKVISTKLEQHIENRELHSTEENRKLFQEWIKTEIQYIRDDIKELRKDVQEKRK